ncbi:MAG: response regulator transcription factor [Chloroflexi bacterium]|nr:response regulator transcription factor [Chloroflexota bacterium]
MVRFTAIGLSNKEIASEMGISERTVQTHLTRIFKKLGVGSRTEMVLYALKEGLIAIGDLPGKNKNITDSTGKTGLNHRLFSMLLISVAVNLPLPSTLHFLSSFPL